MKYSKERSDSIIQTIRGRKYVVITIPDRVGAFMVKYYIGYLIGAGIAFFIIKMGWV